MTFSDAAEAKAVKAANGELVWSKDDVPSAIAELTAANFAVLGGEVWLAVRIASAISHSRDECRRLRISRTGWRRLLQSYLHQRKRMERLGLTVTPRHPSPPCYYSRMRFEAHSSHFNAAT
jgi:hypothetical protein